MNSIKHLIEILNSQLSLYNKLLNTLRIEKELVIKRSIYDLASIVKAKEELLAQEKLQDLARNTLISKIANIHKIDNISITSIADISSEYERSRLLSLKDEIVSIITQIQAENIALRMVYTTSLKLARDFLSEIGARENFSYLDDKGKKISTYSGRA